MKKLMISMALSVMLTAACVPVRASDDLLLTEENESVLLPAALDDFFPEAEDENDLWNVVEDGNDEMLEDLFEEVEDLGEESSFKIDGDIIDREPLFAAENTVTVEDFGSCGSSVFWQLTSDGTLTISGNGMMDDYVSNRITPWYSHYRDVKKLVVEEGVTSIGNRAFYYDSLRKFNAMTEVKLPSTLERIGNEAFWSCEGLTEVTIPSSVTELGDGAFRQNKGLARVLIEGGDGAPLLTIGTYAFAYNDALQTLLFEDRPLVIGESAFCFCDSIRSLTLPEGLTLLEESAFSYCDGLTAVAIPATLQAVGKKAFYNDRNLLSVYLQKGTTSIGAYAFGECRALAEVILPEGLVTLGDHAFNGCQALAEVILPEGLVTLGDHAFNGCRALTEVTLPNSMTVLENAVFGSCYKLEKLSIPDSVVSADKNFLSSCPSKTEFYYAGDYLSWAAVFTDDWKTRVQCAVRADLAAGTITVHPDDLQMHRGSRAGADVVCGNVVLKEDVDYELSYENNEYWGKATIKATGIGNFSGSLSAQYEIYMSFTRNQNLALTGGEDCLSASNMTELWWPYKGDYDIEHTVQDDLWKSYGDPYSYFGWSLDKNRDKSIDALPGMRSKNVYIYTYSRSEIKPGLVQTSASGDDYTLEEGRDYTVTYYNNQNAGFATAVFKGIGYCEGSIIFKYFIRPAENYVNIGQRSLTINASDQQTQRITPKVSCAGGKITYASNNPKITVSSNGVISVSARYAGSAVITVTAGDHNYKTAQNTLSVKVNTIPATSIKLKNMTITQGFKKQVDWEPSYAYQHRQGVAIKWTSSNKSVATIDKKGVVTAKKPGTAKITAKLKNGKKCICKVKIVKNIYAPCKSLRKINEGSYGEIHTTLMKTYYQGKYLVAEVGVYNNRMFRADWADFYISVERYRWPKDNKTLAFKRIKKVSLGISPYGRKKIVLKMPLKKYDLRDDNLIVDAGWSYYHFSY